MDWYRPLPPHWSDYATPYDDEPDDETAPVTTPDPDDDSHPLDPPWDDF